MTSCDAAMSATVYDEFRVMMWWRHMLQSRTMLTVGVSHEAGKDLVRHVDLV